MNITIKSGVNYSLLIGFFALGFLACQPTETKVNESKTGEVFFNDSLNKQWRHRANSLNELSEFSNSFKGFELDVFFVPTKGVFEVKHDFEDSTGVSLQDYFSSFTKSSDYYYWLDVKGLKVADVTGITDRLNELSKEFELEGKFILESGNTAALKTLNANGFFTSYWIPHFRYTGELTDEAQNVIDRINTVLVECNHNAISAAYEMMPFINDYFTHCTTHLWTNGLITEDHKVQILELQKNENVKVILTDYDKPF